MQYITKHYLRIRDKKDWNRWRSSKEYNTIDEAFAAARLWLLEHPGAVVSFMTRYVWMPDPKDSK